MFDSKALQPPVTLTHGGKSDPHYYNTKTSTDKMKVKNVGSFVTFIKPYPINVKETGFWKGYSNWGTYCTEKNFTDFMNSTNVNIYSNSINGQHYFNNK